MSNNSSTGGFLTPTDVSGELNDAPFTDFLQSVVVGITGLPGTQVRPRWQPEPPNWSPFGSDWASIGVTARRPDKYAANVHRSFGDGFDEVYRQEIVEILCSFYGPSSETNSELLSMGLQVPQNLSVMSLAGLGIVEVEDSILTGELIHERWLRRVDIGFTMRRAQIYKYPVLNLLGAQGVLTIDGMPSQPINVNFHTVLSGPLFTWDIGFEFLGGWDSGSWS